MKYLAIALGTLIALLGLLWLLQGLGLVTMAPLLCFADCTPVVGPDATWVIAGAVALVIGLGAFRFGVRRR